jgi:hypothetical protein
LTGLEVAAGAVAGVVAAALLSVSVVPSVPVSVPSSVVPDVLVVARSSIGGVDGGRRPPPATDAALVCAPAGGADCADATRVHRLAGRTLSADVRASRFDDLLELPELGVDALQLGCLRDQDVHPDVIADRHLVEQPAELGLHDREALDQSISLGEQFRVGRDCRCATGVLRRRHRSFATERRHGTEIASGRPCCDFT